MNIYFCVFTQHEHRTSRVIGKTCCIVQAVSEDEAREKAYEKCGGECSALQFVQRIEPCDGFVFTFYKSMMYDIREKMYMDTVKRYTKEEAEKMAEMFALVVMSLTEKPNQDFLGEAFSALGLHNEWKGQFFTPYHVGAFMAAVNIEPAVDQLKDKKLITVSDCCCGAGCLLIAFANEAMKAHIDFQSRVLFVAQDLDYVAGLMCYIQLSLLGCKAIVKIGNSLTDPFVNNDMETDSVWLSPMYTQEETFHMMRVLESIITLSDPEGDKEQDENTDAPTDKVSA